MAKVLGLGDLSSLDTLKAFVVEAVGTLVLVLIGTGVIAATSTVDAALAKQPALDSARIVAIALGMGLTYMAMVALTAPVSGGHINPAVTVAAIVTGRMGIAKGIAYLVAQLGGAIAGAFILKAVLAEVAEGPGSLGAVSVLHLVLASGGGFALELLLGFVLVLTVLVTIIGPGKDASPFAPVVVGLIVTVGTLVAYPLTGAAMNPARAFASAWAAGLWTDHWVYWAGPILGAIAAVVIYEGVLVGRLFKAGAK